MKFERFFSFIDIVFNLRLWERPREKRFSDKVTEEGRGIGL